ncbi:MAG: SNF2-related protein [Candidatus Limnocylindrales bacterium]
MDLLVAFEGVTDSARVTRGEGLADGPWQEWSRHVRDTAPTAQVTATETVLPWFWFRGLLRQLQFIRDSRGLVIQYTDEARARIADFVREARAIENARAGLVQPAMDESTLRTRLGARGWDFGKRELKPEQVRDVLKMLSLGNFASFSVPGAGKTTVALAVHLAATEPDTRLLVVGPKNAFPAWDQVLAECLVEPFEPFLRLGIESGSRGIRAELADLPARSIVSYAQLVRARETFASFASQVPVHLILDESHRIKAGDRSQTGNAALLLSHQAVRRDILSGTPMPNSVADLGPQLDFLWPSHRLGQALASGVSPKQVVGNFYVRTTKNELRIPPVTPHYIDVEMSDPQKLLYGLIRDDVLRALRGLTLRQLPVAANSSVMRLLQVAIDPQAAVQAILASDDVGADRKDDFREVCRLLMEEGVSPRLAAVEQHVRSLAVEGKKALVWSPFTFTTQRLTERLADLGSVAIHGGVRAGDDDDAETREGIVKRFHEDPSCQVLIANPAAGGEGISLHRVCHDAIYVGRTYNAAHFLQSRDRIHRLGLPEGTITNLTFYEARTPRRLGSIDLSVRNRLDAKVRQMDAIFDDPDLRAIALESDSADPTLDDGLGLDDLQDLFSVLVGGEDD